MSFCKGVNLPGTARKPACSRRVQTARATLRSMPSCHVGSGCQWGLEPGELARWEGLLLNPAPVGFKPVSALGLFLNCLYRLGLSVPYLLNMHKAMESFHCNYDTLSSGTLGTALASCFPSVYGFNSCPGCI